MNRLLKRLIKPWTDEMSKCYYCSLWVMNYGAGGLVAREKRKHLMVV